MEKRKIKEASIYQEGLEQLLDNEKKRSVPLILKADAKIRVRIKEILVDALLCMDRGEDFPAIIYMNEALHYFLPQVHRLDGEHGNHNNHKQTELRQAMRKGIEKYGIPLKMR